MRRLMLVTKNHGIPGSWRPHRNMACFADRDLVNRANAMRDRVRRWTTIPACVGIAPTKTLAKLANAAAKKNLLFDDVANLRDPAPRS